MLIHIFVVLCIIFSTFAKDSRCGNCKEIINDIIKNILDTEYMSFQGGDAEYEKKKLVSYSVSETRFLEIIEKIYKDASSNKHRHIEELESDLEDWWLEEYAKTMDSNSSYLIPKFCIPKFCCPDGHFGPNCSKCDGCSIHGGTCNGNGTLSGSGKCDCNPLYEGAQCEKCNPNNSFELKSVDGFSFCEKCHRACKGCKGESSDKCFDCTSGYSMKDGSCVDIDECSENPDRCEKASTYCHNTNGSFECRNCHSSCVSCNGSANNQCSACASGFKLVESTCEDIDECGNDDTLCSGDGEYCVNNDGSYECKCKDGWEMTDDGCQKLDSVEAPSVKDEL